MSILPVLSGAAFLASCGPRMDPDMVHFDMVLVGVADTCHPDAPVSAKEAYTYALGFEGTGSTARLAVWSAEAGYNTFASGRMAGCTLLYDSPEYREERGPGAEQWVQWTLTGQATWRPGGQSCDIEAAAQDTVDGINNPDWASLKTGLQPTDLDWVGLETFQIVGMGADIHDLDLNCTYTMVVAGTYLPVGG